MTKRRHERDDTALHPVRHGSDGVTGGQVEVARITIRMDYFPSQGELDVSFVAWQHPDGVLLRNEIWSHYDEHHVGIAGNDMVARIYDVLKSIPEPF